MFAGEAVRALDVWPGVPCWSGGIALTGFVLWMFRCKGLVPGAAERAVGGLRSALILMLLFVTGALICGPTPEADQRWHRSRSGQSNSGFISGVERRARKAMDPGVPDQVSALLTGMVLGDSSGLSGPVRSEFRKASLTHIVAASGQNIVLLLAFLTPLLAGIGLRGRPAALIGVVLIALYVPLAGAGPPIRRAAIMAAAARAARLRGTRLNGVHALLLAGIVTAGIDAGSFQSLSWQLSMAAVTGMLAFVGPFRFRLESVGMPAVLAETCAVTLAATLSTAPLIASSVGQLSIVAIPANLLAAPAIAPAMFLGFAAAIVGQASAVAAAPFAAAATIPVAFVLEVAHLFASPRWSSVPCDPPGWVGGVIPIGAGVWLLRGRSSRRGPSLG